MFTKKQINWASKVANFMIDLYKVDEKKYMEATASGIPYGDMAYGQALEHWHRHGCKVDAWFSYAEGERPCPLLMAFRKEITAEFKLPILTAEEAKLRAKTCSLPIKQHKVVDWGPN